MQLGLPRHLPNLLPAPTAGNHCVFDSNGARRGVGHVDAESDGESEGQGGRVGAFEERVGGCGVDGSCGRGGGTVYCYCVCAGVEGGIDGSLGGERRGGLVLLFVEAVTAGIGVLQIRG